MASRISFGDNNSGFQAGIINGAVNPTFNLPPGKYAGGSAVYRALGCANDNPPERPETPPRPSAVVPFGRDRDFVERGEILHRISEECAVPGSWMALVGLGGIGKSQLAIEHAYRTRERSPETWVFWVFASNAARFEQSYRDIADQLKLSGRRDPQTNIFQLVHNWLRDGKGRWLLILDNVDDARFLLDSQANSHGQAADSVSSRRPLRDYLPQCEHGSILVTTRSKEAAMKLVEQRDIIVVEPMDEAQALALFKKKLRAQGDSTEISKLAAALEYMPLAIVQAAAYITQRAPRCSVRQYLEEFKKSERKKAGLLQRDGGDLRRDSEAKNSIIVTWEITFQHIHETRPSAADLLSLMSFFDRQGIPEELLWNRSERGRGIEDEFDDDVLALRNFCFISIDVKGGFEMHALVQLATRKWLKANGKLERWKQQSINNLCAVFPTGNHENWARCRALFAHAKAVGSQEPKGELSLTQWATLLYRAAWYSLEAGNNADAEKLALKSMKVRRKVLGLKHKDTLWSTAMVGDVYRVGGRWKEAKELEVQVLEAHKAVLGLDHPDTLNSMNNLALTYWNQGRWDKAEELEVQVLEARKTKLGLDHSNTLMSMNNLASTYHNQGRWEEAKELHVQVLEAQKTKLGLDHPNTLMSMNNLASTYHNQGRWDKAEELEVQVLEAQKTKLGLDHPNTLNSMNNLASTYQNQGRWEEAKELHVQVLEARKTKLGLDHPNTLISMNNLASTYHNQGRWEEAKELHVQVLEAQKTKLGLNHPDTLMSMNNLASTYQSQGRWEEAKELHVQVLEARKTKLGLEHPNTLTSMNNLAFTLKCQGHHSRAISLMNTCVSSLTQVLGADHPNTVSSLDALNTWRMETIGITTDS
ncbi:hypothetical protein B0J11DRAFT_443923 [Dendryphion nanum]|uniref:NB-ARC domain-containing protein n=1 Tax=Dendryphion nanum TaxID=256645 RepID=A0A9P9ICX9_9PLEO|nr:hypothetical protein B0J11DRAFT_443923 [Dendryphion nanum]